LQQKEVLNCKKVHVAGSFWNDVAGVMSFIVVIPKRRWNWEGDIVLALSVLPSVRPSVRPHSQDSNYVARGTIGNCSFSLMSFIPLCFYVAIFFCVAKKNNRAATLLLSC
jgi:hypothetical protein